MMPYFKFNEKGDIKKVGSCCTLLQGDRKVLALGFFSIS